MPKLVRCKACNNVVSSKAPSCPQCGEPQKRTSKFAIAFLIIMLFGLVIGFSNFDEQESKRIANEAAIPSLSISALDLYNAYESNEVAADAKYKERFVLINGEVSDIGTSFGKGVVSLETKWGSLPVLCLFNRDNKSQLVSLKKGQLVQLKGKVVGKTINVGVSGCRVIK